MDNKRHLSLCLFIHLMQGTCFRFVGTTSLLEAQNLYFHLFQNYSQKLIPALNQSQQVQVNVSLNLVSITDFNEISGELVLVAYFTLMWIDEQLIWDTHKYGGKTSLVVYPEDVWRPKLTLIYPFQSTQWFGSGSAQLRIYENGSVSWMFGEVISALCLYDTTFYPFDSQVCKLEFVDLGWSSKEIKLNSPDYNVYLNYYTENGEWSLIQSSVDSYTMHNLSVVCFTLNLQRKPQFPLVYIIIPLILLGGLDYFIIILPHELGERISCAMTVFLSFSVYMNVISDNMPKSSDPISYIYYYLLLLMLLSGSIVIFLIFSSLLHRKVDDSCLVPLYIKYLVWIIRLKFLRKPQNRVSHRDDLRIEDISNDHNIYEKQRMDKSELTVDEGKKTISDPFYAECSWVLVANTCDLSFFVIFGISHMLVSAIYLVILFRNITVY